MDICLNKPAIYFRTVFLMLLTLIVFTADIPAVSALETARAHKSESNETVKEKIDFIHSEILKIKKELEWLSAKIQKMELFKQFVPEKMYRSIKFKKDKIKVLTRLKQKLDAMLKSNRSSKMQEKTRITQTAAGASDRKALLEQKIKQCGLADWLDVVEDQGNLRIENRLPILFASASSTIAKEYNSFLKKLSNVLKGSKIRVFVDGYADIDPINTKKYPSNFELGALRAANVVHALVEHGVNPSVFKIGSTGQYRSSEHKASKWKTLERHVNITVVFES